MRHLVLIFGDQLNRDSAVFDDFDPETDSIWMVEAEEEATIDWCHKSRLVLFFSAMRHFYQRLRDDDFTVHYHKLGTNQNDDRGFGLADILNRDLQRFSPEKMVCVLPGDHRVKKAIQAVADEAEIELEVREDRHFYFSPDEFSQFAEGRKSLLLETFYRQMRREHSVLMDGDDPEGGEWNFDHDNRESFSSDGPENIEPPASFAPDSITQEVISLVESRFSDHPGTTDEFDLPVTRKDASAMLDSFIESQLPGFGQFQDAMWTGRPFLNHSRLSAPLNLKLISPRECVEKAVEAYESGKAPINSVEGFVRQILGWREFVRGIYWHFMPDYQEKNHFDFNGELPSFYWDGETDMACVGESMEHVGRYAYSHHIHRLMIFGNLSLLLGVHPKKFHDWHMAMYADAIDWVSLPNTLGMSQHGDGGIVGTKPYISSGNYINKMSNFCKNCRYNYRNAVGDDACPINTLYWDFLDRHETELKKNQRMGMQLKNLERKKSKGELSEIRQQAGELREKWRTSADT